MRSFAEAKGAAEKSGTARSQKFRPTIRKFIWGSTVVVMLVVGTLSLNKWIKEPSAVEVSQKAPAAAAQQSLATAPIVLRMGPGEESQRVPVPYQMRVVMAGKDFEWNCYYGDGHKQSFLPGNPPCADGDVPEVSVTNLRKDTANTVVASYRRASEK